MVVHRRESLWKIMSVALSALCRHRVDTLFVMTSCNADFNPSRLERYLALAFEARVTPVIILSKVDTCVDPQEYIAAAQSASKDVSVSTVNGGCRVLGRRDDETGRHTTTARFLLRAPSGAWLIDTPGMRELKIGAVQAPLKMVDSRDGTKFLRPA